MNPNDVNDLKEEVSCAYVNFIASRAAYSFQRADRRSDNDGIDGTIKAPRRLLSRRPQLEVQVKGTSRDVLAWIIHEPKNKVRKSEIHLPIFLGFKSASKTPQRGFKKLIIAV